VSDNRFEIERALKTLTRSGCETFTSGIGSCWNDRKLGAQYGADSWCAACTAMYVLALLGASRG
jgi:hypothetical protein